MVIGVQVVLLESQKLLRVRAEELLVYYNELDVLGSISASPCRCYRFDNIETDSLPERVHKIIFMLDAMIFSRPPKI
jgi:hypothetical protein